MDMLRALGTFVRIVETGSFSAVARETNSTPSAVTRLVGQLEEHFRVRLFHRTTRHLSLTEDGQDLLDGHHAAGHQGILAHPASMSPPLCMPRPVRRHHLSGSASPATALVRHVPRRRHDLSGDAIGNRCRMLL